MRPLEEILEAIKVKFSRGFHGLEDIWWENLVFSPIILSASKSQLPVK